MEAPEVADRLGLRLLRFSIVVLAVLIFLAVAI